MKTRLIATLLAACTLASIAAGCGGSEAPAESSSAAPESSEAEAPASSEAGTPAAGGTYSGTTKYPEGKFVFYGYGQPQFMLEQYQLWFDMHKEATEGVEIEMIQCEGGEDARKKVTLTYQSGAMDEMPDVVQTATAQMMDMAKNGILMDVTDFLQPLEPEMLDGVTGDVQYDGKMYALPDSFRPQLLFYNQEIFDQYEIDPAQMDTMEGYIEVGRQLKEKSGGKVYLSFASPSQKTWAYWGRRGLWPQAKARIWDDEGNVVFGSDEGTKLAASTLDTLFKEDLLLRSQVMQPPLYDSIRNGEVATFYIGAFWDEFIRKNTPEIAGKWRMMTAPKYEDIGLRGAPVTGMMAIVNKPDAKYADLFKDIWYDYMFTAEYRNQHAQNMADEDGPCWNPISKALSEDPFWKSPDPFYGDQSFKEMETVGLKDAAPNMVVTSSDAEADTIISDELDRYIAGDQDMDTTIKNIDEQLKAKIGTAKN
ncbi:MAG: sugar ABC transporter substrate-binding protein [Clostridiales bacterium]|uniref:Multiple sugar transport system substrate-binding protein n=1 Tax=Harryflintia acetispora TaxID=1849041 RepID=A0A9X8UMM7_9FIRM|nr:extracellular solute-binding protein [Harryflintia acetispora]PWM39885.1 MAG: sugar ABC transporter substrate-binding protein [Clostridiales bacterium]TCL45490.1 multiple sugar transport system substrate-binding protein [Harryflintia acetispora]